jgi:hypothetical protein
MTRKEKKILFLTNLLYTIGIVCNFWSELNFLKLITELVRTGNLNWKFYMILFLCVTTLLCIIWLIVLIGQVWMNLLRKFIRNNQSVVIISRWRRHFVFTKCFTFHFFFVCWVVFFVFFCFLLIIAKNRNN